MKLKESVVQRVSKRPGMKMKLIATLFMACVLLGANHVCAQDMSEEHPLNFVEESVISAKIRAKLADALMFTLTHILVDTDDHGVVVLSGHARNKEQVEKAMFIARHTEGVITVWNHIRIAAD
jgi:hyperosmotically inducible protein